MAGNPNLIWGTCKSNGLTYYKVAFVPKTQSVYCNCASQKTPCKHALALTMLLTEQPDAFQVTEEVPDWLTEWLSKGTPTKPSDTPEAEKIRAENRQKNFSKRLQQMIAGLDELENWLLDTMRQGLASLEQHPESYFQEIAARLYDTKLSAIGKRIKQLPVIIHTETDWAGMVLSELTSFYLLIRGLRKMEELPLNIQRDLLTAAGVTTRKDELFQHGLVVKDIWMVLGQVEKEEDKLHHRRTWLLGHQTKRYGLILDYAFGNQPYADNYKAGNVFEGQVVYYPSNAPLRVAVKAKNLLDRRLKRLVGFSDFAAFLDFYAQNLAANPWQLSFPCTIEKVVPVLNKNDLFLIDQQQQTIPILVSDTNKWKLLAASGGHPINIFGEWLENTLYPLSVSNEEQQYIALIP